MSKIATKTGTRSGVDSGSGVVVEICDSQGTCCQTSSDGKGLDHPGKDREKGQTDEYTDTAILGTCAQGVIHVFDSWSISLSLVKKRDHVLQ